MRRMLVLGGIVMAGALTVGLRAQQPAPASQGSRYREAAGQPLYHHAQGGRRGRPGRGRRRRQHRRVHYRHRRGPGGYQEPHWGPVILDKVKSVTNKPVTHIINTHTHGDHVGNNDFFPANVEIVVQENTAANMVKMDNFKDPAKKHGLADRTYKDKLTLLSGKESIDLHYFGRAHTNGDTFVVFRDLRVMHAGDVFPRKGTPLIDQNNGASGVDYPDTIRKAVAGIKNVDTVIPGYSTMMKWADLIEFGEFNAAFLSAVQAAKKAGKTQEQTIAEFALPAKFKDYQMAATKDNVAKIWGELK